MMPGAPGLLLSVYARQLENFSGTVNFMIFPLFFISSALYPRWKPREGGAIAVRWLVEVNPFAWCVELVRFALFGMFNATAAAVVVGRGPVFFSFATTGYDPRRGLIRRAPDVQTIAPDLGT
jgi:ABC-2 type transport system permease protein